MRTKTKVWLGVAFAGALAVGFAIGAALGALAMMRQSQQAFVDRWIVDTTLLVRNARVTTPNPPAMVVNLIGSGLDIDSRTLAQLYDRLTPYQRSSLAFYADAAQSIATVQGGNGPMQDRKSLSAFATCLKTAHDDRRVFNHCAAQRGLFATAHAPAAKAAAKAP